jgi:hypothetical protein
MNILQIGTTDIVGGAGKVSWTLKQSLEAAGHTTPMYVVDKRSDDASVHTIPRVWWQKYASVLLATDQLYDTNWLLSTPEYQAADIVHCHNLHGRYFNLQTLQKMSTEKPVVWTLHDEWAITPHCAYTLEGTERTHYFFACPSTRTEPWVLFNNDARMCAFKRSVYESSQLTVVTPSRWLGDRVATTPLGQQPQRHIPNGIDTKIFQPTDQTAARKALGPPG